MNEVLTTSSSLHLLCLLSLLLSVCLEVYTCCCWNTTATPHMPSTVCPAAASSCSPRACLPAVLRLSRARARRLLLLGLRLLCCCCYHGGWLGWGGGKRRLRRGGCRWCWRWAAPVVRSRPGGRHCRRRTGRRRAAWCRPQAGPGPGRRAGHPRRSPRGRTGGCSTEKTGCCDIIQEDKKRSGQGREEGAHQSASRKGRREGGTAAVTPESQ